MNLIVCVSKNMGIGKDNRLLFKLPSDLKYFKEKTLNKAVIMGRKTFSSLPGGKGLPNRRNIVLSRGGFNAEGAEVVNSISALAGLPEDSFVIGGAEVYSLLLPYCKTAYVTEAEATAEADAFFPKLPENWVKKEESAPVTENGVTYRFVIYENRRVSLLPSASGAR